MTTVVNTVASLTRNLVSGLAAIVLVLGLATSANAQQSGGSIKGTVSGASAGTVVEVVDASRGLTKSESVSSDGSFRFDNLQAGTYEVRVLSGGSVVDSETVRVQLGAATTIAMATTAEAIEEIVTTGQRVAAIDTSIAEQGLVIDHEALLELPVQRDLASVALLAPGVSRGDYRFGGSGNVSFAGASIAENTSFINEVMSQVNELAFDWLDAPMERVAAANVPVPRAEVLEDLAIPNVGRIVEACRKVVTPVTKVIWNSEVPTTTLVGMPIR